MKIALIPCGPTVWRRSGRLLGTVELPLAEDAPALLGRWAEGLRPVGLARIVHAPDGLSKATARALAKALRVSPRVMPALAEVHLGLWTGLTAAQLSQRFGSAAEKLEDAPLNVAPPEGESLAAAATRIGTALQRCLHREAHSAIGIVARPMALALARGWLDGARYESVWQKVLAPDDPVVVEWNHDPSLIASAGQA